MKNIQIYNFHEVNKMSEILKRLQAFRQLKGKKVKWKLDKNITLSFLIQEMRIMEGSESITTFIYHLC